MSVTRRSSASPQRRIPRKPVSPTTRNHAQHVKANSTPVRGRKPLPGLPTLPDLKIQNSPGSPVRVYVQPDDWSFPTGYTAEFNDSRETRRSRRFSSGEQYFSAQEEPWNSTPPPPPPHLQLSFLDDNNFNFSDDFRFPMPGQYIDSLRVREGIPALYEEKMSESRDESDNTSTYEVFPDAPYQTPDNTTFHTPTEGSIMEEDEDEEEENDDVLPLQYHPLAANEHGARSSSLVRRKPLPQIEPLRLTAANNRAQYVSSPQHARQRTANLRPVSSYSAISDFSSRGRSPSALGCIPGSPGLRVRSAHSRGSLDHRSNIDRPTSSVLDLNASYRQAAPNPISLEENNAALRPAVGANASLLSIEKTLEMYLKNASKSQDPETLYRFALLLIARAKEIGLSNPNTQNNSSESLAKKSEKRPSRELEGSDTESKPPSSSDLIGQAKTLLKTLADRSYPFAQYYLADGYTSGLFAHKGKPDWERAFPLFVAASKHGHTESGYRAGLCYEFGWGCRKDAAKAVQFYRLSASKNHPGAMTRLGRACISGDLGQKSHREGLKWLRRAQETADSQYNSAPYHLGVLYVSGFGDCVFKDEAYAAQLFTQAADLGHAEAAYRMGEAYEHGRLSCPKDAGLSVHFYAAAAHMGHVKGMMGVCAWYMIGAEPFLEKDDDEAYEWARKAAELGYPKAEYTLGYFTEMGLGTRCDPLEANVLYVRAAEHGDDRAINRLKFINQAAAGGVESALRPATANKIAKSASTPNMKAPLDKPPPFMPINLKKTRQAKENRGSVEMPTLPYTDLRKDSGRKASREPLTAFDPVNSSTGRLEVPGQQQHQPRTSSLRSNTPSPVPVPVTTGGPRFSLDESPQKPKRGVLRKKKVQDEDFEEGDVVYVGTVQKDEKIGGIGGKDENKRKWFGWRG